MTNDRFRRVARGAALLTVVLGAAVFILGWVLGLEVARSVLPGSASMKPNTAASFALAGASLYLQTAPERTPRIARLSLACALFVAAVGALTLLEHVLGVDLKIDEALLYERTMAGPMTFPARMAPNTALNFTLTGAALALAASPAARFTVARDALGVAVLVVGYVAVTGYALSVTALYGVAGYTSMAFHTAAGFVAVAVGILVSRPERGLGALLAQDNAAGAALRRQLPFIAAIPLALGWLRLEGQRADLYGTEFGLAMMVTVVSVGFAAIAVWNARAQGSWETERKRASEQFRSAIDAAPTGMLMVDGAGTIVLANRQIERLFGYAEATLLGEPVELLVPERFRRFHPDHRRRYFDAPEMRPMGAGGALHGLRKDGTELPVEIALNPLRTAQGEFILGSVVDITERQRAERERESLLAQLGDLNTALEQRVQDRTAQLTATLREREVLLQEVHHRVKNNLAIIVSLMAMQARLLERGESRDALEECQGRVHAIAMIHEKLYQSKNYADVPFAEYLRGLASDVFTATGTSGSTIGLTLEVEDIAITVDEAIPCGLILNELITNALKHAFPGGRRGTIRVEFRKAEGGSLCLVVSDDGVGVPPGVGFQEAKSLGLRLVGTLAKQLGGEVTLSRDEGTRVELIFTREIR